MNVKLGKTNVMVSGEITKDGMSKSKADPCVFCSMRVKANSALCVQCGWWIHGTCVRVKMVIPKFLINFVCRKCEVEQEKSYVMKWKLQGNSNILVTR